MDTNFETYLNGISHTLETLVAPQIESRLTKTQVYAVVELLRQLEPRLEYRHDLILDDIAHLENISTTLQAALKEHSLPVPQGMSTALPVKLEGIYGKELKNIHDQLEITTSDLIKLFFQHKEKIRNADEIEREMFSKISSVIMRNVKLMRPPKRRK